MFVLFIPLGVESQLLQCFHMHSTMNVVYILPLVLVLHLNGSVLVRVHLAQQAMEYISGVHLHRAQQGMFHPQEVLSSPPNLCFGSSHAQPLWLPRKPISPAIPTLFLPQKFHASSLGTRLDKTLHITFISDLLL